jgi:hypothetical protein
LIVPEFSPRHRIAPAGFPALAALPLRGAASAHFATIARMFVQLMCQGWAFFAAAIFPGIARTALVAERSHSILFRPAR